MNKKAYINWKAVAVNSKDLDQNERELLGFSPSFQENEMPIVDIENSFQAPDSMYRLYTDFNYLFRHSSFFSWAS